MPIAARSSRHAWRAFRSSRSSSRSDGSRTTKTLATLAKRKALYPFAHGARHELAENLALYDSFHCSRYNTNTGRLTTEMFRSVFDADQAGVGVSDFSSSRACAAGACTG